MTPLVISETASSMWSYHLRQPEVDFMQEPQLFPGGGAPPALCGAELGWDTKIPLEAWGEKSHIPYSWCAKCAEIGGL